MLEPTIYQFLSDPEMERGCCDSCPNRSSEASEYAQNAGCLPTPFDIVKGVENGDVWECHSRKGKTCACATNYANIPKGGIKRGELNVICAGINVGKPTCGLGWGTLNGEQY